MINNNNDNDGGDDKLIILIIIIRMIVDLHSKYNYNYSYNHNYHSNDNCSNNLGIYDSNNQWKDVKYLVPTVIDTLIIK